MSTSSAPSPSPSPSQPNAQQTQANFQTKQQQSLTNVLDLAATHCPEGVYLQIATQLKELNEALKTVTPPDATAHRLPVPPLQLLFNSNQPTTATITETNQSPIRPPIRPTFYNTPQQHLWPSLPSNTAINKCKQCESDYLFVEPTSLEELKEVLLVQPAPQYMHRMLNPRAIIADQPLPPNPSPAQPSPSEPAPAEPTHNFTNAILVNFKQLIISVDQPMYMRPRVTQFPGDTILRPQLSETSLVDFCSLQCAHDKARHLFREHVSTFIRIPPLAAEEIDELLSIPIPQKNSHRRNRRHPLSDSDDDEDDGSASSDENDSDSDYTTDSDDSDDSDGTTDSDDSDTSSDWETCSDSSDGHMPPTRLVMTNNINNNHHQQFYYDEAEEEEQGPLTSHMETNPLISQLLSVVGNQFGMPFMSIASADIQTDTANNTTNNTDTANNNNTSNADTTSPPDPPTAATLLIDGNPNQPTYMDIRTLVKFVLFVHSSRLSEGSAIHMLKRTKPEAQAQAQDQAQAPPPNKEQASESEQQAQQEPESGANSPYHKYMLDFFTKYRQYIKLADLATFIEDACEGKTLSDGQPLHLVLLRYSLIAIGYHTVQPNTRGRTLRKLINGHDNIIYQKYVPKDE